MKKIITLGFLVAILSGCAHPINISPDISAINKNSPSEKIDKKLAYYFQEDIEKEVTTPGGGGDSVKYKPYKELDTGIYKVLSDVFKSVVMLKTNTDKSKDEADYVAEISISTNSSSSSAFTWPPTLFGVNINADFKDVKSGATNKVLVSGEGRAEFSEFKSNFNLSAKRASEDALNKLGPMIISQNSFKIPSANTGQKPEKLEGTRESRLRELKRLYDAGLIDATIYNERQKSILAE